MQRQTAACSESDSPWGRDIEGPIGRVDPHPLGDGVTSIGPRLPDHAGMISKERMGRLVLGAQPPRAELKCDAGHGHWRSEHESQLTVPSEGMGLIAARSESKAPGWLV